MMAQQQKARKPPQDAYAQHGKTLASSVQRLRGWVGSDPSRAPELADALVELTAHRLLGHGYPAAATDAQEAVRRAAQLLTANGPIGPYTSVTDAIRYIDAVVHLATVQAWRGLPDTAGRAIESLRDMQQQLQELRLDEQLKPRTAIWALSGTARAALASGAVATANAYADAVLARLAESGLRDDPDAAFLAIDADRLASDCRWAAGRHEDALTHLHGAKDRYEEMVDGRLQEPARLSPALLERLAEPLFGLYRDLADRLAASGEVDLGMVTRRRLVETLRGLAGRLGDSARAHLASALSDLAEDLLAADRVDEADAAADEAATLVLDWSGAGAVRLLAVAVRARTLTRTERSAEAVALLRRVLPAEAVEVPSAAHAVGLLALAEALRAEGDLDAALSSERAFDAVTRDLVGPVGEGPAVRSAMHDLARGVVGSGAQPLSWAPLDPSFSYAATTAAGAGASEVVLVDLNAERQRETDAWLEAERAEAHRMEVERLEHARMDAERREAERVAAERALAEQRAAERARAEQSERLEAERRAAAEEAERLERKRRREERLEAHRQDLLRQEAERREAERLEEERRAAERLAADPAEAERLELERLRTELAELERAAVQARTERLEAERVAVEQAEVERVSVEQAEAERVAAEQAEAEQLEAEQRAAQQREAEQRHPETVVTAPDELALAQQEWRDAKAQGDRRGARMAVERVVELLRPRADADPAEYGPQLQDALEELSSARLRSGDIWGSRAPAKEAKALAKTLGR